MIFCFLQADHDVVEWIWNGWFYRTAIDGVVRKLKGIWLCFQRITEVGIQRLRW